jgi:hypothetical protein
MCICVCLRILASSRIPRYDLGRQTLISEVVLSQTGPPPLVMALHMFEDEVCPLPEVEDECLTHEVMLHIAYEVVS